MRSNSGSSPRSGNTPRAMRRSSSADSPDQSKPLLDDDIEEWLERAPQRARGKTRRAIRHSAKTKTEPHSEQDAQQRAANSTARKRTPAGTNTPAGPNSTVLVASKKPRRPFWQHVRTVCFALCGVLALEGGAALLSSPRCAIGEVAVQGARETSAVELDMICTSLIGQNFLRADRKSAIERTRQLPTVAAASLRHDWLTWPPRLVLSIEERTPFARVGGGDNWWVVDKSGMPFRPTRAEDEKLYAVTSPRLQPRAGKPLQADAWKPVVQFAELLSRDSARAGNWNLRRVYFDRHGFASLRLTGGQSDETLVQLGADGWAEKLQSARWALNDMAARGRHAQSINLISSSVATWIPRVVAQSVVPQANSNGETTGEGTPDPSATSGTSNSAPA